MHNKRRTDTRTKHEGTPTGSVTHTVTFYPNVFEDDREIIEKLETLAKVKKASDWLRDAALMYLRYEKGGQVFHPSAPAQPEQRVKPKEQTSRPTSQESAVDKAATSMGLTFGKGRK